MIPKAQAAAETSLFDGIDVSLGALARYAGERPPQPLVTALGTIAARVDAASRALETRGPSATVPDLVAALTAVRDLATQTRLDGADRQREVRDRAAAAPEGRATAGRARSCAGTADRRDGERRARRAGPARGCLGRHRESRRGGARRGQRHLARFRRARRVCRRRGDAERAVPMRWGRQHAARRAVDGCLLAAAREHGTRHVRRGCAVWTAFQTVTVPRARRDDAGGRAHRSRASGAVPVRRPGTRRREAHGAERRSGVRGQRVAADRRGAKKTWRERGRTIGRP